MKYNAAASWEENITTMGLMTESKEESEKLAEDAATRLNDTIHEVKGDQVEFTPVPMPSVVPTGLNEYVKLMRKMEISEDKPWYEADNVDEKSLTMFIDENMQDLVIAVTNVMRVTEQHIFQCRNVLNVRGRQFCGMAAFWRVYRREQGLSTEGSLLRAMINGAIRCAELKSDTAGFIVSWDLDTFDLAVEIFTNQDELAAGLGQYTILPINIRTVFGTLEPVDDYDKDPANHTGVLKVMVESMNAVIADVDP
jgi:hypothetical protein